METKVQNRFALLAIDEVEKDSLVLEEGDGPEVIDGFISYFHVQY